MEKYNIDKRFKGNGFIFGCSVTEAGNINVRVAGMNGIVTNSGRVFHARNMKRVEDYVRNVKPDQEYLNKYNVHERVEPMPEKRKFKEEVELMNARLLHLCKYIPQTETWVRIAKSFFAADLKCQMRDGGIYRIEEGKAYQVKIPISQYTHLMNRGIVKADINEKVILKGANNRSKGMIRAGKRR